LNRKEGIPLDEKITVNSFTKVKIIQLDQDNPGSRAMCAKLRRAVGKAPGESPGIWEITLQNAPEEWDSRGDRPSNEEWAVHTALTLYALHRQGKTESVNREGTSFASAIGGLVREDENRLDAILRRFNAMATSVEFTELAYHARGIIQMLRADNIKMDYPRFAQELYTFQLPGRADGVRLKWGEDFYRELDYSKRKDNE